MSSYFWIFFFKVSQDWCKLCPLKPDACHNLFFSYIGHVSSSQSCQWGSARISLSETPHSSASPIWLCRLPPVSTYHTDGRQVHKLKTIYQDLRVQLNAKRGFLLQITHTCSLWHKISLWKTVIHSMTEYSLLGCKSHTQTHFLC